MEVVGALVIVEEVISSTLQAGAVAGVSLGKPTLPLKCRLSQFARSPQAPDPASLSRAHHTINVVDGDLYIFGGFTAPAQLASNDVHIIKLSSPSENSSQYQCVPALGREGEKHGVPQARAGHSSCSIGERILVFGGTADLATNQPVDADTSRVWVFDTKLLQWSAVDVESGPLPRSGHRAATYDNSLMIIHGGTGADSKDLKDTWAFNMQSGTWSQLPDLPNIPADDTGSSTSLTEANGSLYLISHSSDFTATVHTLDLKGQGVLEWQTHEMPIAFLNPGPRPRKGAGLVTIQTGQGRTYLLYIFGASADTDGNDSKNNESEQLWSGIWALQLPASGGAGVKDAVRESIGLESKELEWAEVEIVPNEQVDAMAGKAHPGPRAYFGCDIASTNQSIALWGGVQPDGSYAGDGWIVSFASPPLKGLLKNIPGVGHWVKSDE